MAKRHRNRKSRMERERLGKLVDCGLMDGKMDEFQTANGKEDRCFSPCAAAKEKPKLGLIIRVKQIRTQVPFSPPLSFKTDVNGPGRGAPPASLLSSQPQDGKRNFVSFFSNEKPLP
ncbi:uncharacterized protein V6R79_011413 [Siganus canaliculatus]